MPFIISSWVSLERGLLSGAEGWEEISEFGKQKQTWLKKFLGYDNGIPSASTIKRVISLIEAETLLNSYINWINSIREQQDLTIIAIDGKTLKQSYQNSDDKLTALHSISAYLNSIIEIVRIRHDKKTGEQTTQTAYYISSLSINPEQLNYVIKRHWAIENSLHYVLDVTFKEDSCRIREQQATKNMALFRRASVSLIKSSGIKGSVKSIVKHCGWNHDILEQVVFGKTFVG